MPFSPEDIQANRKFFEDKLRATKQMQEVARRMREVGVDFVVLDTRRRESFARGHIQGAWCVPLEELPTQAKQLPRGLELITYCANTH